MGVARIPSVEGGIQPTLLTTKGDIIAATAASTVSRLAVGTNGQVLTADSSEATGLKYATPVAGMTNPMTTTGDIIYSSPGSTPVRLGIGSSGQVLNVNGGVPAWTSPTASATSYSLLNSGNTTLPTGASSFTVSGLTSFNNYFVFFSNVGSASSNAFMQFRINASSASNYNNFGWSYTNSSSFSATDLDRVSEINTNVILFSRQAGTNAMCGGINIQGGASTGTKMYQVQSGATGDGARAYNLNGHFSNSALITSLQLFTSSGNFNAGSMFIYGGN